MVPGAGPSRENVIERGFTAPDIHYASLYEGGQQYHDATGVKRFSGHVLGYVTPWSPRGYDLAVTFRSKLTHVSPVWYQLKRQAGSGDLVLTGGHEHNQTWIEQLRRPSEDVSACLRPS